MRKSCGFSLMVGLMLLAGCGHHTMGDIHEHMDGLTPPPVQQGFDREFPGLTILHTDRITLSSGIVQYELKFRDAKNDYKRLLFSADGKLLDSKADVVLPAK